MAPKKVFVRGTLTSVTSQRTQYKPYGYELSFPEVKVEIEVPAACVLEQEDGVVVLSLGGLNHILEVTADSVDSIHNKYLQRGG